MPEPIYACFTPDDIWPEDDGVEQELAEHIAAITDPRRRHILAAIARISGPRYAIHTARGWRGMS